MKTVPFIVLTELLLCLYSCQSLQLLQVSDGDKSHHQLNHVTPSVNIIIILLCLMILQQLEIHVT